MTQEWIEQDPEFSKTEGKTPYYRLLLCVDPWLQQEITLDKPLSQIRAILNSQQPNLPSIPFDTVYTSATGFLARQVGNNDPNRYTMTWRIRRDLRCEVVLPLPLYAPDTIETLSIDLNGYQHTELFLEILKEQGHVQPRVTDLNFLMSALIHMMSQYRRLLDLTGVKREFYIKARVLNAWRIVPFIDAETILNDFCEHGLPMVMDSTITVPEGYDPDSFEIIDEEESEHEENMYAAVQAALAFESTAQAFGIPAVDGADRTQVLRTRYSELWATGSRAMKVQENRSERHSEW